MRTGSAGFEISGAALSGLTWYGLRPLCSADRLGEQYLYTSVQSTEYGGHWGTAV